MAMHTGGCIGLRETTGSHCSSFFNGFHHELNVYIGKNFFAETNYQSILECLDGGKL
jgi:hypothetical protein